MKRQTQKKKRKLWNKVYFLRPLAAVRLSIRLLIVLQG